MEIAVELPNIQIPIIEVTRIIQGDLETIAQKPPLADNVTRRVIHPVFEQGKLVGYQYHDWYSDSNTYRGQKYIALEDM